MDVSVQLLIDNNDLSPKFSERLQLAWLQISPKMIKMTEMP
jgi:hypothetical protein